MIALLSALNSIEKFATFHTIKNPTVTETEKFNEAKNYLLEKNILSPLGKIFMRSTLKTLTSLYGASTAKLIHEYFDHFTPIHDPALAYYYNKQLTSDQVEQIYKNDPWLHQPQNHHVLKYDSETETAALLIVANLDSKAQLFVCITSPNNTDRWYYFNTELITKAILWLSVASTRKLTEKQTLKFKYLQKLLVCLGFGCIEPSWRISETETKPALFYFRRFDVVSHIYGREVGDIYTHACNSYEISFISTDIENESEFLNTDYFKSMNKLS